MSEPADDPSVRVHPSNGHLTSGGAGPGIVTCRLSAVTHLVRSRYARVIEALPEPEPETIKYGLNPSVTFTKGTPIMLDPAGSLLAAIGSGKDTGQRSPAGELPDGWLPERLVPAQA